MVKSQNYKTISFAVAFVLISFFSCNKEKEKTYSNRIFNENTLDIESKINFRTVASLHETNKKVIDIASIAFNNSQELSNSKIILKIKKDHLKIESELKKITNENLIIIPEPIFDLNLNETFLEGINSNYYLVSLLEKEINIQINLLDSIKKTSRDVEFISFANKSKEILKNNNKLLEDILEI